MEDINRIKVVLVEKNRTNSFQPDLNSLLNIADLLEVAIKELIIREYKQYLMLKGV